MDKLISRSGLARLCNVQPSSVTTICKKFPPEALVANRIDLNNAVVIEYVKKHTGKPPPDNHKDISSSLFGDSKKPRIGNAATREQKKNKSIDEVIESDVEKITDYRNMPLQEIIDKFGSDASFCDWLRATKLIEDINEKRIKNAQLEASLVSRDLVIKGIIDPMNGMLTRILTDGVKTVSRRTVAMVQVGADAVEVEDYIYKQLSSLINPTQSKIKRSIKNA
jgi:hypothetical protein